MQVHYILQEVVMGGMVLETNMNEIVAQVEVQNRMEKSEVSHSRQRNLTIMSTSGFTQPKSAASLWICAAFASVTLPVAIIDATADSFLAEKLMREGKK